MCTYFTCTFLLTMNEHSHLKYVHILLLMYFCVYVHILRPKVPQKLKILKKIIISELLKSIRNCYQQLPFTEKYAVDVDSCTFLGQLQAALFITPNTYFTVLSIQTEGYVWSNVICTSHCTPNYRLQVWKRKSTTLKSALCPSAISRVPN